MQSAIRRPQVVVCTAIWPGRSRLDAVIARRNERLAVRFAHNCKREALCRRWLCRKAADGLSTVELDLGEREKALAQRRKRLHQLRVAARAAAVPPPQAREARWATAHARLHPASLQMGTREEHRRKEP